MKKSLMSFAVASAITTTAAFGSADVMTLYKDTKTGQVYTDPGEGREEIGSYTLGDSGQDPIAAPSVTTKHDSVELEFSGEVFAGYTYNDNTANHSNDKGGFEIRRSYFTGVASFDKAKDTFFRLTIDAYESGVLSNNGDGSNLMRIKYAYLGLDDYIPNTNIEFGIAHRPLVDYLEHSHWWYRSINKTFTESDLGSNTVNSADGGIRFLTQLKYFTSDVGLYNGPGYDHPQPNGGASLEWRFTANALGTGNKGLKKDMDYLNFSFAGGYDNQLYLPGSENWNLGTVQDSGGEWWYGIYGVYNTKWFLLGGEYIDHPWGSQIAEVREGQGFAVNWEVRPWSIDWSLFGRYGYWEQKNAWDSTNSVMITDFNQPRQQTIIGVSWQWIPEVQYLFNWIGNNVSNPYGYKGTPSDTQGNVWMLTANITW